MPDTSNSTSFAETVASAPNSLRREVDRAATYLVTDKYTTRRGDEELAGMLGQAMEDYARISPEALERALGEDTLGEVITQARTRQGQTKPQLVEGVEPEFPGREIPLDEAEARLLDAVRDFFAHPASGLRLAIDGGVGVGKTHAVLDKIARRLNEDPQAGIDIYAKTHDLGEQSAKDLDRRGVSNYTTKGRQYKDFECIKREPIDKLSDKEVTTIGPLLCEIKGGTHPAYQCEAFNVCGYHHQFAEAANYQANIRPHDYLPVPPTRTEYEDLVAPRRDRLRAVVVDENPTEALMQGGSVPGKTIAAAASELWRWIRQASTYGGVDLAWLERSVPNIREWLDLEIDAFKEERPGVYPSMSPEQSVAAIKRYTQRPLKGEILEIVREAYEDRDKGGPGRCNGVWRDDEGALCYARLRHFDTKRVPAHCNLMILDGSFDAELWADHMPGLKAVELHPEQQMDLTQVWDKTFSKSTRNKTNDYHKTEHEQIPDLVATLRMSHEQVGVIGPKEVIEELRKTDAFSGGSVITAHFNALRGLNTMNNVGALVVIGRMQPPAEVIEVEARAYFPHQALTFAPLNRAGERSYVRRLGGYRMRSGELIGVAEFYHPDPRISRVLAARREAEIYQAIGRVRAVRRESPVPVYLLGPLPVDVTVDRLVRWTELVGSNYLLPLLRATGGALPLSVPILTRQFGPEGEALKGEEKPPFSSESSVRHFVKTMRRWREKIAEPSITDPQMALSSDLDVFVKRAERGQHLYKNTRRVDRGNTSIGLHRSVTPVPGSACIVSEFPSFLDGNVKTKKNDHAAAVFCGSAIFEFWRCVLSETHLRKKRGCLVITAAGMSPPEIREKLEKVTGERVEWLGAPDQDSTVPSFL